MIDWKKYAILARQTAAEGAVLLKNDKETLPLKKGTVVSVFGRIQLSYYKSGTGSGGLVNTPYTVGILDALKEEKDICLNTELLDIYEKWVSAHPFDLGDGWAKEPWCQEEMPLSTEQVQRAAEISNIAIVILGRTAGEDQDTQNQKGSYLLTDLEEDMLSKVCASFEHVAVLLNVGNILDMKWVAAYNPSAVMYVWQGGMEGGHGVADVLTGRVNPCGKLTDTIAGDIRDYPSTPNFGGEKGDFYKEDIYVGYRYFETFAKDKVLYPFGFGLSYSDFRISVPQFWREKGQTCFTIEVINVGNYSGKEVVQIYSAPPQGKLGKPFRNLCAFAKTELLAPGQRQVLEIAVPDTVLASYDDNGQTGYAYCYVLEKGTYQFYVGNNIRTPLCAGEFSLSEDLVTQSCSQVLAPVHNFERMKAGIENDRCVIHWEPVPLRIPSASRCKDLDTVPELTYCGNQGYVLADVYHGKVSMEDFISQLSDEDLFCIVRGEGMGSPKVTPGTAAAFGGVTDSLKSFGIPCGCCADGPSGIRMDCGTQAFSIPNGTCIACTFNEKLVQELFEMLGLELRQNKIDTILGPGMNIHRNPLNGRNFEYFSEDPYLTGKLAAAELKGMHKYGVTGTIKHFAANNQEHNRTKYNSQVSERALREIYLKGFEIAVKEGSAYFIMTTYGAINGIWTAGNHDLLTTVLRSEWGFEGIVMTDWWAKMNDEGQEASAQNLAAMIRAQNDVYMVVKDSASNSNQDNLKESLEEKKLSSSSLQRCAMNICKTLLKTPAMERMLKKDLAEEAIPSTPIFSENLPDSDIPACHVDGKAVIDGSHISTKRGSSPRFLVSAAKSGIYRITFKVKSDVGAVAQIPMSVFSDEKLLSTITLNGTEGQWIEVSQDLTMPQDSTHLIRLYFAQSGLEIESITFTFVPSLHS